MLALYHMVGGTPAEDLPGLDQLLSKNGLTVPKKISHAVLVGTSRGPQDVISLEGGQKIRTTWGEMAWQLGGAEALEMIAENDARGIAPGSNLLEAIFNKCAPCLILIDEWVAYLRQIYRVARAVFMGTAPTHGQENRGLDNKQINLGVVQPGERPTIFGDALRRLTNQAKFMHSDLGRYWYSMSASLNRIAAAEIGLQLDHRVAPGAGQPLGGADQQVAQAGLVTV